LQDAWLEVMNLTLLTSLDASDRTFVATMPESVGVLLFSQLCPINQWPIKESLLYGKKIA
jgi:hypothetical protein